MQVGMLCQLVDVLFVQHIYMLNNLVSDFGQKGYYFGKKSEKGVSFITFLSEIRRAKLLSWTSMVSICI